MISLKTYDLYANQKLLIADLAPQDDFRNSSKQKLYFIYLEIRYFVDLFLCSKIISGLIIIVK